MLDALKKALGQAEVVAPDAAALASLQAEFDSFRNDANALLAVADSEKTDLIAQLEAAQAALEAAQAEVEQLRAAAKSAEEAAAEAAAAEAALRKQARNEKLVAAVGTEKAPSLLAAFEDMDDAKFDAVLAVMAGQVEAEAKSEMFQEVGATAEVTAPGENETMRILRERYKQD